MNNYSIYPKQFSNIGQKIITDTCFVIMPFCDELNNTYMVIETAANTLGIKCIRADNVSTTSEPILSKICNQISQAYFIVVDITNLNPNVFYELGIAHVLRDAQKVLIIKDKETSCPSDIRHLHYYEYSKNNLKQLKNTISSFFTENNISSDLYDLLNFRDILPKDKHIAQSFVDSITAKLDDDITCLIYILNNQENDVTQNQILKTLANLTNTLSQLPSDSKLYDPYTNLLLLVISKVYDCFDISEYIDFIICGKQLKLKSEWIAKCCIAVLDNNQYFEQVMGWILAYLETISPAEFDLTKYAIEIGLIKSDCAAIDNRLIEALKSCNKTLVEHAAKIIKERKTVAAVAPLLRLVEEDQNPYVVRSCIDALISIAQIEPLLHTQALIKQRKGFIQQYSFINKHLEDLERSITALDNGSKF